MRLKRALVIGVLVYITTLILGAVTLYFYEIDPVQNAQIPNIVLYVNVILTIAVAALFTLLYFKDNRINRNAKEGLYFGLVLIVMGFVFDLISFAVGKQFLNSQFDILEYYSNPIFLTSLVLFVVTTTFVGWVKGRTQRKKLKS